VSYEVRTVVYIIEDGIFHSHRRENLKSYIPKLSFAMWVLWTENSLCFDMRDQKHLDLLSINEANQPYIICAKSHSFYRLIPSSHGRRVHSS
jgi:hypothetical protein